MNIKEIFKQYKLIVLGIAVLLLIVISSSYAIITVGVEGNSSNVVKVGNLLLNLDETASAGILINPAYPLTDQEGLAQTSKYIFTLQNDGNINADFTLFLDDITTAAKKMPYGIIRYNLKKQVYDAQGVLKINQPSDVMTYLSNARVGDNLVLDGGSLEPDEKITYTLNLWMDYDAGNEYQGSAFKGKVRIEGTQQYARISNAYTYNASTCVTGNESTCVKSNCYKPNNTCSSGDIIDYMVNGTTKVRFHVMYDENGVLTMQSQNNIISTVAWNSTNLNTDGPTTVLSALDTSIAMWTNPNNISYTLGTTTFKTNAYTSCSAYNSCSANKYTFSLKTAKARLMTVQEAANLGCSSTANSCPTWMHATNGGYWLSNASSSNDTNVYAINGGSVNDYAISTGTYGARAVIQINK